MEKAVITTERYQVSDEYYVDVKEEIAGTGERDYWLCNRKNPGEMFFMCTKRYRGQEQEEKFLSDQISTYIVRYERAMQ